MLNSNHSSGGHPAGLSSTTLPKPSGGPGFAKPAHQETDLSPIALDGPIGAGPSHSPAPAVPAKSPNSMGIAYNINEHEKEYKRTATLSGNGAVHIKSFHCHLSDDGLRHLDTRINDWLDAHGQYEVKFVTSNIGLWDGKTKDPELIVNVWY